MSLGIQQTVQCCRGNTVIHCVVDGNDCCVYYRQTHSRHIDDDDVDGDGGDDDDDDCKHTDSRQSTCGQISVLEDWQSATVVNSTLVVDPTIRLPGFDLHRRQWSLLNRFWTGQGHCNACHKKWGFTDNKLCDFGEIQTMSHIVNSCPLTSLTADYCAYMKLMRLPSTG